MLLECLDTLAGNEVRLWALRSRGIRSTNIQFSTSVPFCQTAVSCSLFFFFKFKTVCSDCGIEFSPCKESMAMFQ